MKKTKQLLIIISILCFSMLSKAVSNKYYVGVKKGALNELKRSNLVLEVLIEYKAFSILKIKAESKDVERIKSLSFVDFIDLDKSITIKHGRIKSSINKIESDAPDVILGNYPWGIEKINAPMAWEYARSRGKGAKILILDTGIQIRHPAIFDRVVKTRDFTGTKISKYVPENFHDIPGHGTHVATTIAGNGFNKLYGVAPESDLYIGKVCVYLCQGDAILKGLEWAVEEKVDVINMSFSAKLLPKQTVERVFEIIEDKNILAVAAAGNGGRKAGSKIVFPAKVKTVLAVGAVNKQDLLAVFSTTGSELSLVAPGVDIMSASPVKGPEATDLLVKALSGTSMAAPHVAGVGALLKSMNPLLPVKKIREIILESSVKSDLHRKFPNKYGAGRLDALSAVKLMQESFLVSSK